MRLETLAVHAGRAPDPATGAVATPIVLSTTFARDAEGGYPHGFVYSRAANPNRQALERCLAALEGGAVAAAFSSGMAATAAMFQALAPGDHVVLPDDTYYGTATLVRELFGRWGLESTFVDMRDARTVAAALRPTTRLVWVETPSNPLLTIADIGAIVAAARAVGARVGVDNTWGTPIGQRPLSSGADIVMHATTKYLAGHGDVLGGVLIAREDNDFFKRVRAIQTTAGAVPSPFECWLTLRGISTLPYRVRAQSESAGRIARALAEHPGIDAVYYPGLEGHRGHEIARRQMLLFGGMLSILVRGGRDAAMAVASRVTLFTHATSLGGVESLIDHRASVEHPETTTPQNLLRLSIGLEHVQDLLDDLMQALRAIS